MKNTLRFYKCLLTITLCFGFVELSRADQIAGQSGFAKTVTVTNKDHAKTVGFESVPAGKLDSLSLECGVWTAEENHATIHSAHQRNGKNSLRLLGGRSRQVEWSVAPDFLPDNEAPLKLDFWFERWTQREPFEFKVEVSVGKVWRTIHHDKSKAVVGSFKNHLSLSLPTKVSDSNVAAMKIRFSATTPVNAGVMIDDIRIIPETPMNVISVKCKRFEAPVLLRNEVNVLFDVQVETSGTLDPISLTKLDWQNLTVMGEGKKLEAVIAGIDVFGNGLIGSLPSRNLDALKKDASLFGSALANETMIGGSYELRPGINHIFISARLNDAADIDGELLIQPVSATIAGKTYSLKTKALHSPFRLGVALRKAGDDKSSAYRIPGLATSKKGTLLAVYDIRRRGGRDLPGDVDVGMSRSIDGGKTWSPMTVIMDMGDDPKWYYDGVGDPAILVDQSTGTIWCAATWSHGNRSWNGSGPGLKPEDTGQLMLVKSDDDGLTWSKPINITSQVKKPEWCFLLQGPGKGITMRDGTIVFAAQFQDTPENNRLPRSTILYSKDHGETWAVGTGAFDDTTESQVVEIEPGVLMLNCRYNRDSTRVVMTTKDMGKSWQKHATSQRSLIEPRACMGSLINVDAELGKPLSGNLLFSNPDSLRARERIMMKASTDNGKSWPKANRLLIDEGIGAGYSCMTMIDEETVGILYEGNSANLVFQRIKLSELFHEMNAADDSKKREAKAELNQLGLSLPKVFQDHMVMQAGKPLQVFGTSRSCVEVSVTLGGELKSVLANKQGRWRAVFASRRSSFKPISLQVIAENESISLEDILIGDVWLCAGQSNMEWPVSASLNKTIALKNAGQSRIRLCNLVGAARGSGGAYVAGDFEKLHPSRFMNGKWLRATANSVSSFSAVGWYFGRALENGLGASTKESSTPIGLINVAIGGAPTESWIDQESLRSESELKDLVTGDWLENQLLGEFCRTRGHQNLLPGIQAGENVLSDDVGPNHSFKPGFMWAAAIRPLLPFSIRGVLWYQGESNAENLNRVQQHDQLFRLLVEDWRRRWNDKLPFFVVQLPAMKRDFWPHFRESQRKVAAEMEGVECVTTLDTGHRSNVHPPHKKVIGERSAQLAMGKVYGRSRERYSAPAMESTRRTGNAIEMTFGPEGIELISKDGNPLRHFEVAGNDKEFFPAIAKLEKNRVTVSSQNVSRPEHLRYAFVPYPEPPVNLYSKSGYPVSPLVLELSDVK